MKYKIFPSDRPLDRHDGYVICLFSAPAPAAASPAARLLGKLGIKLADLKKSEGFSALETQDLYMRVVDGKRQARVALVGLGRKADADALVLGRRMQRAGAIARARSMRRPAVILPAGLGGESLRGVILGLHLGLGERVTYAGGKKRGEPGLVQIVMPGTKADARTVSRASTLGRIIVEARSWVSEPANMLGPDDLARRAAALGRRHGVRSEIWKGERIRKERMGLLEAVGRGSARKPRFVRMRWSPGRGRVPHVVIVGKGIVFDTGGLSLKPAKSMPAMKNDMAGASVAAAVVSAAAALRLRVRVTALLPIAENTPSSTSYRPGDVVTGRAGKSVEIINTDAEGRLVMADALALAADAKPDAIIDVATLTGSCIVALGSYTAGLWANDEGLARRILKAADAAGESMWRMPLLKEIRPYMRSDVADIRNTQADPYGGAIAAALFLGEFVGGSPWAHLDIAGPAFHERRSDVGPRGATGYGISTLVSLLEDLSG